MLQNKINTLKNVLEVAKNEISQAFVDGFHGVVDQVKVIQPDLDTSDFGPFRSVVDGKNVNKE